MLFGCQLITLTTSQYQHQLNNDSLGQKRELSSLRATEIKFMQFSVATSRL